MKNPDPLALYQTIGVEIIRADGTRVPLGVVADSRWAWWKPKYWSAMRAARNRTLIANQGVEPSQPSS